MKEKLEEGKQTHLILHNRTKFMFGSSLGFTAQDIEARLHTTAEQLPHNLPLDG